MYSNKIRLSCINTVDYSLTVLPNLQKVCKLKIIIYLRHNFIWISAAIEFVIYKAVWKYYEPFFVENFVVLFKKCFANLPFRRILEGPAHRL